MHCQSYLVHLTCSSMQLIEKYEVQRFNIEKLHQTIDQLLVFKVERDKLQEEKELLMEVNSKYDFHIDELKNKVRLLMNELQSQREGGGGHSKGIQQQIKSFNLVDSSTQTSSLPNSSGSSTTKEGDGQGNGSARRTSGVEELAVIPPPPPLPLGPEDGALIPPPPPIPFGKT